MYPEIEALNLQDTNDALVLGMLNFNCLSMEGQIALADRLDALEYHRDELIRRRLSN